MNQPTQAVIHDPQPDALAGDNKTAMGAAKTTVKTVGGPVMEMIGGVVVVVLAVMGLVGATPGYLLPIIAITVGVALLLQDAAMVTDYFTLFETLGKSMPYRLELGGGMSIAILAGLAGIILGILAFYRIVPGILTPVAAIVFGTGLLLGIGAVARLNSLKREAWNRESPSTSLRQRVAHEAMIAASATQALVGLAAITLGIIALTGIQPEVLTLIAMLVMGAGILLSGAAAGFEVISGRAVKRLPQPPRR